MHWAALALLLAPPGPAVDWRIDAPLTLVAGAAWFGLDQAHADLVDPRCPCSDHDVNRLDRDAVFYDYGQGEAYANATVTAALIAPFLALAVVSPDAEAYADDALLVLESVALTGLATQGAKTLVGRPYPYMYRFAWFREARDADGVNYASFWSGHTAVPMAAAVSFAVILDHRHPERGWRWVAWTVGPLLALTAGALQVSAGNHFVTDVAAGAAVGAAVGWTNAWLRF